MSCCLPALSCSVLFCCVLPCPVPFPASPLARPWLERLASNLKREHNLRIMLNSYVWGRIFSHVQKAKAAVYRWVVVGFSVVCVRGCVWWLQQSCVLNSGSRKARKYCVLVCRCGQSQGNVPHMLSVSAPSCMDAGSWSACSLGQQQQHIIRPLPQALIRLWLLSRNNSLLSAATPCMLTSTPWCV